MNYSELTTAIQDYTENTFSATELATFVEQAEQRIYNSIQFPSLRKNVVGSFTAGNRFLQCPDDFLAAHSLSVSADGDRYTYLLNKDANFILEAYALSDTGTPQHYALYGPRSDNANELVFVVGPTPLGNYTAILHYYHYPTSIVTAGTSWLGDNFDSVLLYGSLVEAYTFMKGEPDLLSAYNTKYNEALQLAKRLGDGLERQDSYRSGQVRVPVT
jgi:hypothetical protein